VHTSQYSVWHVLLLRATNSYIELYTLNIGECCLENNRQSIPLFLRVGGVRI